MHRHSIALQSHLRRGADAFGVLPTEIWDDILAYLPLSSKAALTISCHYMYRRLGETSLRDLQRHLNGACWWPRICQRNDALQNVRSERSRFLLSLQSSVFGYYYCLGCEVYHPYKPDDPKFNGIEIHPGVIYSWNTLHRARALYDGVGNNVSRFELPELNRDLKLNRGWHGKVWATYSGDHNQNLWLTVEHMRLITPTLLQQTCIRYFHTCQHLWNPPELQKRCRDILESMARDSEDYYFYDRDKALFCSKCPSQYMIFVEEVCDKKVVASSGAKYNLVIERMIDLGDVTNKHNPYWYTLTHPYIKNAFDRKEYMHEMGKLEPWQRDGDCLLIEPRP